MSESTDSRNHNPVPELNNQDIIDNAPIGIFTTTPGGRFISANRAMVKMFRYESPEEMIASVTDIATQMYADPGDREEFTRLMEKHGEVLNREYRLRRRDGTEFWSVINVRAIRDESGRIVAYQGFMANITERKQTEKALRESEMRFQKMLGVVPDMISIQNPEMDILYSNWQGFAAVPANQRKLQTKCYKTYRNFDDICPDCLAKSVLETRKPVHEETRLPDGTWYDIRVIPIFDKENNIDMFMEWVRDITDRKLAEETLRSNYGILQIAGETARLGGWSVDLEKNICTWSDAVADIHEMPHGYAPPVEDAINFYAPEWHDKITEVFNDCAQKGIPYDEEMEIITSKGKRVWVKAIGRAVKNETGKIIKVQGAFQDITEYKQAEEKLHHSHRLMKYIIEHTRSAIAVHDRDLKYIYVSQRYLDEYNIKDKDIIGKHHYEVFPDLPRKWREVHQKALAGEVLSAEDDPYEREDGSVEWTRWECRPWYESDGSIGGIIIYTEVITERKQREQVLTEQKELLA
ncbi:MAG: PAS domain-containing protein, partial [Fidelibacterota bacterium]